MNNCNILQITQLIGFGWNLKPLQAGLMFFFCDTFQWLFTCEVAIFFPNLPFIFSCMVNHGKHICKRSSCLEQLVKKWGGALHCSGNNFILVFRTETDVIIKVSFADKFLQKQVKLLSTFSSFHSGVIGCVKWLIKIRMVLDWKHAA